jgi:hypothetical protein
VIKWLMEQPRFSTLKWKQKVLVASLARGDVEIVDYLVTCVKVPNVNIVSLLTAIATRNERGPSK